MKLLVAWALSIAVPGGSVPLTHVEALDVLSRVSMGRETSTARDRDPRGHAVRLQPRTSADAGRRLAWLRAASAEPDTASVRSRGDGPLTPEERARRDAAVQALVTAEAQATESPETAETPLQAALRGFAELAPLVSDDARAQDARAFALLALARTRLVLERPQDAAAALDEALVTMRGRPLPVEQFGPALAALHDERVRALATVPEAKLTVLCTVPCRVMVDELPFVEGAGELPAGAHRVWVEARTPDLPVLRRALVLAPGEPVELAYEVRAPAPAPPESVEPPEAPRRLLPRWASVLGLAAGASAVAAGSGLVVVDFRCPDLSDPRVVDCPRILDTETGGFVLIGLGSAAVIAGAVILALDEVRARRARRRR